jgi:hypothetical protein
MLQGRNRTRDSCDTAHSNDTLCIVRQVSGTPEESKNKKKRHLSVQVLPT